MDSLVHWDDDQVAIQQAAARLASCLETFGRGPTTNRVVVIAAILVQLVAEEGGKEVRFWVLFTLRTERKMKVRSCECGTRSYSADDDAPRLHTSIATFRYLACLLIGQQPPPPVPKPSQPTFSCWRAAASRSWRSDMLRLITSSLSQDPGASVPMSCLVSAMLLPACSTSTSVGQPDPDTKLW